MPPIPYTPSVVPNRSETPDDRVALTLDRVALDPIRWGRASIGYGIGFNHAAGDFAV